MRPANVASLKYLGVGLLALLLPVAPTQAQRPPQSQKGESGQRDDRSSRSEPAPRGAPARVPEQRPPVAVERVNHGTIRHVDTQVVQRPVAVRQEVDVRQRTIVHRDVDADFNRSRYWDGFVYGRRVRDLRVGYLRVFVSGAPYFWDDGIYYQQVDDGYQEVYPPVGAVVPGLPDGAVEIEAGNIIYYYAGGAFYVRQAGGFVIAPPPLGVIVPELPPGAVAVSINGGVAYQFNGIYYQPVFVNGVTQYQTFMP